MNQPTPRPILLILAALLPALFFLLYTAFSALNYPLLDDYDAGLNFANHLVQLPTFPQRFSYFLAAQHNEYKLFLDHGVLWLQLALLGHVNFTALSMLGNLSVALLGLILWKLFLPEAPFQRRLTLFLPVCLLLFQFQYWETLDWPMAALQNLPVLPCAFASFYLLARATTPAFLGAVACLTGGVAASGNGFVFGAVGTLLLLLRRRWMHLAVWIATLAALTGLYAYRYNPAAVQDPRHQPLLVMLTHPHGIYLLGFLGSAARLPFLYGAVLLGAALCVFFAWATLRRGYLQQEPVIGYCLLFLLLTGIGVSGLRAGFGLVQSTSSRYEIYSDLLLIFAWFALVRITKLAQAPRPTTHPLFRTALALSLFFFLGADALGIRDLRRRNANLQQGLADFERSGGTLPPVSVPPGTVIFYKAFPEHARTVLLQSESLGVYHPR